MENTEIHKTDILKVRIPSELKEYVKNQAEVEKTDMSKLMRKIISDYQKKAKRKGR